MRPHHRRYPFAIVASVTPKELRSGVLNEIVTRTGFVKGANIQIDSGGGFVSAPISSRTSKRRIVGKDVGANAFPIFLESPVSSTAAEPSLVAAGGRSRRVP